MYNLYYLDILLSTSKERTYSYPLISEMIIWSGERKSATVESRLRLTPSSCLMMISVRGHFLVSCGDRNALVEVEERVDSRYQSSSNRLS